MGEISNIDFFKDAIKKPTDFNPTTHNWNLTMHDMTMNRTDYKNVRGRIRHFYDNSKRLSVRCETCNRLVIDTEHNAAFRILHFSDACLYCIGFA